MSQFLIYIFVYTHKSNCKARTWTIPPLHNRAEHKPHLYLGSFPLKLVQQAIIVSPLNKSRSRCDWWFRIFPLLHPPLNSWPCKRPTFGSLTIKPSSFVGTVSNYIFLKKKIQCSIKRLLWNWSDWSSGRFHTSSHCPPPPTVSILSLLPFVPPFLNQTAGVECCRRHSDVLLFSCVYIYIYM